MKKIKLIFALLPLLTVAATAQTFSWRDKVSPEILQAFNRGERADVIVVFKNKADLSEASSIHGKTEKARFVFGKLQAQAQQNEKKALAILQEYHLGANSLFLVHALSVSQADVQAVSRLAVLDEVQHISFDPWVHFPEPVSGESEGLVSRGGIEWGVEKVNAPALWALGYTGQGITVGGADTGYEWTHPALQPHYRGWNTAEQSAQHNYNWHDAIHTFSPNNVDSTGNPGINPCGYNSPFPCDDHFHGTHTMGTMTGDDGAGNQVGVAPGAKWIGCRNMERGYGQPSSYLECFQWFLAPTDLGGQNADPSKAPHVINNSWYCDYIEGCTDLSVEELLHDAVINLKASGVFVVVSNGNEGGSCATTNGAPAYFEESFSIGSIRINDTISNFSSKGPVIKDQSNRIKPNVVAPGHDVRSCDLNGGYRNASGTSMAGPHVVGVVALLLSARPDLAGEVETLEDIIEETAVPRYIDLECMNTPGTVRPNNTYGYGRVDALAALNAVLAFSPVQTPETTGPTATVVPNPVTDDAMFNLQHLKGFSNLTILNGAGQIVYFRSWNAESQEILRAPLASEPSGIYFWQIRSENGLASGKFVKK